MNFTNGIVLLLSVVKHRSEFDTKVNFPQLYIAIEEIDTAMGFYQGNAQKNVREAARLNKDAQSNYHKSVGPVFDWCGETIANFNLILPNIKKAKVSIEDKHFIWKKTVTTINDGLTKTEKSLKQLDDVQVTSSRVKSLLETTLHDTYEDFKSNGYYGRKKNDIQKSIYKYASEINTYNMLQYIAIVNIASIGIEEKKNEQRDIEQKFQRIIPKIRRASQVAETLVIPYLEEDITNMVTLRGKTGTVDNLNPLLEIESVTLRTSLAGPIQDLIDQCGKYRLWHGKN